MALRKFDLLVMQTWLLGEMTMVCRFGFIVTILAALLKRARRKRAGRSRPERKSG